MKRIYLLFLAPIFSTGISADVGSCALYFCEISLHNDSSFTAYIQYVSSGALPTESTQLFKELNQHIKEIKCYSKIEQLEYPKYYVKKLTAASIEDTHVLLMEDIQSLKVLSFTACEWTGDTTGKDGYSTTEFLISDYHPVIEELTQREIQLLSQKSLAEHGIPDWDIGSVLILNYNSHIDEASFKALAEKLHITKHESETWDEYYTCWQDNYTREKEKLRAMDIIVISFMSYT